MIRNLGLEYLYPSPQIVVGKGLITTKIRVGLTATLLVDNNQGPRAYALVGVNPAASVFIGNAGVTVDSGFPVDASNMFVFGMLENTKLYGVAQVEMDVYILDMGF